jgi:hypothetical protein
MLSGSYVASTGSLEFRVENCGLLCARPNAALQPTCGARVQRGGELRRRRMRLDFGVRIRLG